MNAYKMNISNTSMTSSILKSNDVMIVINIIVVNILPIRINFNNLARIALILGENECETDDKP